MIKDFALNNVNTLAAIGSFCVPKFTYHGFWFLKKNPASNFACNLKMEPLSLGILKSAPAPNSKEWSPIATKAKNGGFEGSSSASPNFLLMIFKPASM